MLLNSTKEGWILKVCFIGHRTLERTEEIISSLKETVLKLIKEGAIAFLFGSMSDFNSLSWEVVTELKKEYPFIKRIYVRATYPKIEVAYEKHLLEFYEETYYPESILNAGKTVYIQRNYEMINKSKFCIMYFDENYVPTMRNRKTELSDHRPKSGTQIAHDFALKKHKMIINIFSTTSNKFCNVYRNKKTSLFQNRETVL